MNDCLSIKMPKALEANGRISAHRESSSPQELICR
ncbi:Uncharacterised protein [Mycobacteroides abscessus subsp. abscessus]|nr:Uncharacterised protein [Mycobacteroides abscessus subsp. abscessus]